MTKHIIEVVRHGTHVEMQYTEANYGLEVEIPVEWEQRILKTMEEYFKIQGLLAKAYKNGVWNP
jgi:hypothetical protein